MQKKTKLKGDALIGILSYTGFALGILLVSIKGFNADIFSYLFGNILTISQFDLFFSGILSILTILFILIFYKQMVLIVLDEESAKASGVNVDLLNYLFGILIGIAIVISIRIIGIILVAAFMIFPASSALNIAKSFRHAIFLSIFFGILSLIIGISASILLNLAAGATIVIINFLLFLISIAPSLFIKNL